MGDLCRKGVTRFRVFIPAFFLFFGCFSGCFLPAEGGPLPEASLKNEGAAAKPEMVIKMEKIDPMLRMEIEKLTSVGRADEEIDLLIRTRMGINPSERGQIETRGGKIGSVIGDILTVRIQARAILEIADLEFVVSIEKAKRLRLK